MYWDESEIIQILPFYNSYINKPKVKKLNNVQLLNKLPFYDELSIVKKKLHLVVMEEVIKLKLLTKEM